MRVAFVGWGAIARAAAELLVDEPIEIVAVATRGPARPADIPAGAAWITDPAELAVLRPDVVAEAAGRDSVAQWAPAALAGGADVIVSSASAFSDDRVLERLRARAIENGRRIHIHAGALAGVEALAAARAAGLDTVEHRIVKPPSAWRGTPAESLCALDELIEPRSFFAADAAETAATFPKNANVAMTIALAGVGPERTMITLVADPDATTNRHEIHARGAFGRLDLAIDNHPLPANPKTSALAAYSLARAIRNLAGAVVI